MALVAVAGCNCGPELLDPAAFEGEVDGKQVALYTIQNEAVAVQVTNFGARVVSTFTQDRDGKWDNIVVCHDNLADYVTPLPKYEEHYDYKNEEDVSNKSM